MFAGLDYGTSSSAIGTYLSGVNLIPLVGEDIFVPSTLYTFDRNFISEYVANKLAPIEKDEFTRQRRSQLNQAASSRVSEGFEPDEQVVFFGKSAIENYIESPEEGIFIKSPKSFLGATGLSDKQTQFFEDLVTAMILNIKSLAESKLQESLSKVVIGRPVNFQGVDSAQSNQQALKIMTTAAHRCGFKDVEYLFEPLAAGVDFESQLHLEQIVLVIDIGGGTTDCSMVKMGPSHVDKLDRSEDFLAHTGRRIGGNDLDIALSYHQFTQLLGKGSLKKKGIEVPSGPYWSAVSINHIGEQGKFSSQAMSDSLLRTKRDAQQPKLIERFIHLQKAKLNHRLVRSGELAKIGLSELDSVDCDLNYIEKALTSKITREQFKQSINKPVDGIKALISDCIKQAGVTPNLVYVTGGSAKSPVVKTMIDELLPNIQILDGDYYGSVTAGLTKWAHKIWR